MVANHNEPVRLRGTLNVIQRKGQRGAFNIGELSTHLCEFKIIDQWLEQLEPGQYTGEFFVSRIEPKSNVWRSRVFLEIRATVVSFAIDDVDQAVQSLPISSSVPERDPLEEEKSDSDGQGIGRQEPRTGTSAKATGKNHERTTVKTEPEAPDVSSAGGSGSSTEGDASISVLFGDLAELVISRAETIKLDPTVDRDVFRSQRDHLKSIGYTFDVKEQWWRAPRAKA